MTHGCTSSPTDQTVSITAKQLSPPQCYKNKKITVSVHFKHMKIHKVMVNFLNSLRYQWWKILLKLRIMAFISWRHSNHSNPVRNMSCSWMSPHPVSCDICAGVVTSNRSDFNVHILCVQEENLQKKHSRKPCFS